MRILDAIIRREGGFVDHPSDRGGATKYGITRQTLEEFRGQATKEDVRDLSESEARRIYERLYLVRPGFDRLANSRLQELVVDCAVNHGPRRATRWLQKASGASVDGNFGPLSLSAVRRGNGDDIFKRVLAHRCRFYGRIISRSPSQAAFAAGWTARVAEFIERGV